MSPTTTLPRLITSLGFLGAMAASSAPLWAETRKVTSDQDLYLASRAANPGDVVEIEGGRTYKGRLFFERAGEKGKPIVVRGIPKNGKRPVISGGDISISISADHYVFESLEVTGGTARCVFVAGHDVTLRDMIIHDCPVHGLLSADDDSGTLLVDRCEFYRSGSGDRHHQIYVTTDQFKHPGSTFRLQHSYIHDATGGHSVKSRAERNEIYFNWIEGAQWHELELLGPDVENPPERREDSDVVGNVFVKKNPEAHAIRIGGDGTMDTDGRYRFVNNTWVMLNGNRSAIRLFEGVESVELYNNVFVSLDGAPITLFRTDKVEWTRGKALVTGSHNFIPDGSKKVLDGLKATIGGSDPKLVDLKGFDLRPADGSPLVDAGVADRPTSSEAPFPSPLAKVSHHPPPRRFAAEALPRPDRGAIDVGAYEAGPQVKASSSASAAPAVPAVASAPGEPPSKSVPTSGPKKSRCLCAAVGQPGGGEAGWAAALLALGLYRRRRR